MGLGINLHSVVRPAVTALHPDTSATLYQSTGQAVGADGQVKSAYAPGLPIVAQKQSESPAALFFSDRAGATEESRKFYLTASPDPARKVTGLYRPLARGGDMFQCADGVWWLVDSMIEDFSASGWVCVRATLQVEPPDFGNSAWWEASGEALP